MISEQPANKWSELLYLYYKWSGKNTSNIRAQKTVEWKAYFCIFFEIFTSFLEHVFNGSICAGHFEL